MTKAVRAPGVSLSDEERGWRGFLGVDDDAELAPELRALVEFHRRPGVPAGAVFHDGVQYRRAGPQGLPLRLWMFSRADVGDPRPAVIFVHSGGWYEGTPFVHMRHAHQLAAQGYVTATIEYRLHPAGTVDDALSDTRAAVRWVRARAAELGVDPTRIAVAGASAGGHLSAMAALAPDSDAAVNVGGEATLSSAVQAVLMLYPMLDLPACTGILVESIARIVGEDPATVRRLSPISHVRSGAPPMLSICGDLDSLTPLRMVARFHTALDRAGVVNRLVALPGREHGFDLSPADWQASLDPMAQFLGQVFA